MDKRFSLVPVSSNYEECLDYILEVVGQNGVSLKECLDNDSLALSSGDMKYFNKEYYGMVPSYGLFIRYLNKLPGDVRDSFNEALSEIEGGRYERRMDELARGDFDEDPYIEKRFRMYDRLNGIQERRLKRIDDRRRHRGEGAAQGIDLAAKLISALKDSELIKIKDKAEMIDSEYKEVAE